MERPFLKSPRLALAVAFLTSLVLPGPVVACQCQTAPSACSGVAASNLVFIGDVESVQPVFLSRWNTSSRSSLALLNGAYTEALEHPSDTALTRLKEAYGNVTGGSGADARARLDAAKTVPELVSLFSSAVDGGMRVRFRVKTLFRREDNDDDDVPKKAAGKAAAKEEEKDDETFFDISTPFGDCGFDFQAGETYLVYANNDEGTGDYATGSCTRTRRLSEAGEDLTYLFYYKSQPDRSTRLEAFVTTDASNQFDYDNLHDPEIIRSSVPNVVVELRSDAMARFAPSNRDGRSVFDGLPEGDYLVTAFAAGYPFPARLLAGPQSVHLEKQSCARRFVIVPKGLPKVE